MDLYLLLTLMNGNLRASEHAARQAYSHTNIHTAATHSGNTKMGAPGECTATARHAIASATHTRTLSLSLSLSHTHTHTHTHIHAHTHTHIHTHERTY